MNKPLLVAMAAFGIVIAGILLIRRSNNDDTSSARDQNSVAVVGGRSEIQASPIVTPVVPSLASGPKAPGSPVMFARLAAEGRDQGWASTNERELTDRFQGAGLGKVVVRCAKDLCGVTGSFPNQRGTGRTEASMAEVQRIVSSLSQSGKSFREGATTSFGVDPTDPRNVAYSVFLHRE